MEESSPSALATVTIFSIAEHFIPFLDFLNSERISTGIHYPVSLPFLPAYKYKGHEAKDFPIANEIQSQIVSLPLFPAMSNAQTDHVLSSIKKYFN